MCMCFCLAFPLLQPLQVNLFSIQNRLLDELLVSVVHVDDYLLFKLRIVCHETLPVLLSVAEALHFRAGTDSYLAPHPEENVERSNHVLGPVPDPEHFLSVDGIAHIERSALHEVELKHLV